MARPSFASDRAARLAASARRGLTSGRFGRVCDRSRLCPPARHWRAAARHATAGLQPEQEHHHPDDQHDEDGRGQHCR